MGVRLGCRQCGTYAAHEPCADCGNVQHIGASIQCPHDVPAQRSKGFEPYYDYGLAQIVTGVGDINKACRPRWENDQLIHIQPRDKGAAYYRELAERREARRG